MNQDTSSILRTVLDIAEYQGSKEEVVQNFINNLEKEIKIEIASNQEKSQADIAKSVSERAFEGYLNQIMPTLNNQQKQKLADYLSSLSQT